MDSLSLQRTIETKQYNLESAEGCYSMALMYSRDIKAKYAVKVIYVATQTHRTLVIIHVSGSGGLAVDRLV